MRNNKLVVGLLVGLSIGGIFGVLFAPKKGSKLKKKCLIRDVNFVESLKSKFGDVITNVPDSFELTQKNIEDKISLGKAKWSQVKVEIKI